MPKPPTSTASPRANAIQACEWRISDPIAVTKPGTGQTSTDRLPTTTFTSVASSFLTGGTGTTLVPQHTASLFTSLISSSTNTSTPATTTATGSTFSDSLLDSFGGQPTGSTALSTVSSQPTGAPLCPQATGFHAGVTAFKPSPSFGASLSEALPPIPQSEPTTLHLTQSSPARTTGTTGANARAGGPWGGPQWCDVADDWCVDRNKWCYRPRFGPQWCVVANDWCKDRSRPWWQFWPFRATN